MRGTNTRRRRRAGAFIVAVGAVALAVGVTTALADDEGQPVDFTHNVLDAPAPVTQAVFGTSPSAKAGEAICTTATQTGAEREHRLRATQGIGPHNETSIAVNPTNTDNIIGGANDYQLGLNPGGHVTETVLSRAHVTFDGGHTWTEYPITFNSAYQATGDPAVAFDAAGHAYYATLGFRFVGPTNAQNPDVLVANSGDGGKTWTSVTGRHGQRQLRQRRRPARQGVRGRLGQRQRHRDLRRLPARRRRASFTIARIFSSVTHDGGATWSTPQVISGNLDQAFVSVPTVAADGRIFVAFLNTTDLTTGRDDYEVVEVSPTTGARVAGPFKVATDDRRLHRLPDRVRPADLPGQPLPVLGGRQHHGRSDERGAPRGRLVGHAQQPRRRLRPIRTRR